MESIYVLIPISILLVFFIGYFFWWSSSRGQFDDLKGPGFRVVMDDDDTYNLDDRKQERQTAADAQTAAKTAEGENAQESPSGKDSRGVAPAEKPNAAPAPSPAKSASNPPKSDARKRQ